MYTRRTVLTAGLTAWGLGLAGAAASTAAAQAAPAGGTTSPSWCGPIDGAENAQRALASWAALQRYLAAHDGSNLVHQTYPAASGDPAYSYEWPFSQVHVAAMDLATMRPSPSTRAALAAAEAGQEHYWETTSTTGLPGYASGALAPYGSGGDLFYDDNAWVGLQKVQLFLTTGDRAALARAEQIFALLMSGWDSDAAHADPGGIFWTQASWSTDRNTVSNMPPALLGARLYAVTGTRAYLDGAVRSYDWTNRYLLDTDGLYSDHVSLDGTVQTTKWSYNQGIPLAAAYVLSRVTRDRRYLAHAIDVAEASYSYYVESGTLGTQPIYFDSIYLKCLLLLASATRTTKYVQAARDYADLLWTSRRDAATGLFSQDTPGSTGAIEQAAATQVFAVLGTDPGRWSALY